MCIARIGLVFYLLSEQGKDKKMTDQLLAICQQYGFYVQFYRDRVFIAMGTNYYGIGKTLSSAVENWMQSVEKRFPKEVLFK